MPVNVEDFYRKYGPMVLRRCRKLLMNEEKAKDAMQDVFVRILQNEKRLKKTYPSSLLYVTATNVCLNIIRKEKRNPRSAGGELLSAIAGNDDPEKQALTLHFLDRLFNRGEQLTKTIAVLHYMDRLTLEETAEQVNMSVSGVRKRLRQLKELGLSLKEV